MHSWIASSQQRGDLSADLQRTLSTANAKAEAPLVRCRSRDFSCGLTCENWKASGPVVTTGPRADHSTSRGGEPPVAEFELSGFSGHIRVLRPEHDAASVLRPTAKLFSIASLPLETIAPKREAPRTDQTNGQTEVKVNGSRRRDRCPPIRWRRRPNFPNANSVRVSGAPLVSRCGSGSRQVEHMVPRQRPTSTPRCQGAGVSTGGPFRLARSEPHCLSPRMGGNRPGAFQQPPRPLPPTRSDRPLLEDHRVDHESDPERDAGASESEGHPRSAEETKRDGGRRQQHLLRGVGDCE